MSRRVRTPRTSRRFRRSKALVLANLAVWVGIAVWYAVQPAGRQRDVARLAGNVFDRDKDVSAFELVWDIWQLYARDGAVPAVAAGDRTHLYGGEPESRQPVRVLSNTGYVVGYSDSLGLPLWAAYRVADRDIGPTPPRPDGFEVDRRTSARVEPFVYAGSGYDRGHLAPNFAVALHHGVRAQEETFLMSNIVPQRHALNAGAWSVLERRIATNYAARFGEVWVIAGPVLGERPRRLARRVAVPDAFFMVVVDESEGRTRAQAFLFPQEAPDDAQPAGFLTTIDEIERRTGLDLLRELPDEAELALEARRVSRMW